MSDIEKLKTLTSQMHLEPAEEISRPALSVRAREAITVKTALMPNGESIRLLKTLLSSYCERNCRYCPFRSARDIPRAAFSPDDFARLFISLYRAGFVEGIFLSSSIFQNSITTQDKLLATADLLRNRYDFRGYLHLKIMPGAEQSQVHKAMLLADRLSLNLEAPHPQALSTLAPQKDFRKDLLKPLIWIEEIRKSQSPHNSWNGKWPSSTTQFVVGAGIETDHDILMTTARLRYSGGISRAYFSSFTPIPDTPLENTPSSPPQREQRLYQSFFLLRDYGFTVKDLVFEESGNLPRHKDPKLAWAERNLLHNPVEINTAPKETLLRVPGLGPIRVDRILALRRQEKLKTFSQLRKSHLVEAKTAPFLLIDGKKAAQQPNLF